MKLVLTFTTGPLFEKRRDDGPPRPFKGSAIVVTDVSRESIEARLASDVYVSQGIWDLEKALITPFRTRMRREG